MSIALPTYNIKLTMELNSKKWIEHYQLTNMIYTTPLAQFWNASHQVLKKTFVLKKINIKNQSSRNPIIGSNQDQAFDLAKNQTRLLNSIKSQAVPKCHKLIRTTSSSYVIYDGFRGQSLSSFMNSCAPSSFDISIIIIKMARQLSHYHRDGTALFLLTQSSIFISEDKSIMFTDWTLAIKKEDFLNRHQQFIKLVKQITNYTITTFESLFKIDLYALGIIFEEILSNHQQGFSPVILHQFKVIIAKMTSKKQNSCLDLPIIMKDLEKIKQSLLEECCETPSFNRGHLLSSENIKNQPLSPKLKRMKSNNIEMIKTERFSSQQFKVAPRDTEFLLKSPTKSTLMGFRGSLSTNLSTHFEFIGKIILKNRSLTSFLLILSIDMQGLNPQLSFLLLKIARSTLKMPESSSKKLKYDHENIYSSIKAIIAPQIKHIQTLLTNIQRHLFQSEQIDEEDVNYSSINSSVNQKHLHSKIKQTIKSSMKNIKDSKIVFSEATEIYFQLYILSKSIQYGSYEKFWEKYFHWNKYGQIQKFIKSQKKLGLRYFKNKLEMALEKID